MSKNLKLPSISYVNGYINLPGSKSISNRVLLLSAIAKGSTYITNLLNSDDVQIMLKALQKLGIKYVLSKDKTTCQILGNNGAFNNNLSLSLFLGNAGTAMRSLTAVLTLKKNEVILTGDNRMKERPIKHLIDALIQAGANIEYLERHGFPPIRVKGEFSGGEIVLNGSISSQFLTAILMASPLAKKNTIIKIKNQLVSKPYISMTIKLMKIFGVSVINKDYKKFIIKGLQQYISPNEYKIEGDASSSSYFLAAAAIKGGSVKVIGINKNSIQGDIYFAKILKKMGAIINWGDDYITCTRGTLRSIDLDLNKIPDSAMTLAIVATFATGHTKIKNIYNWRVKETDRLSAMAKELKKIGAIVEEGNNFIAIQPPTKFKDACINTYNDHRMAMCFSLLSLSNANIIIQNPKCVNKTFPEYFNEFFSISTY